MKRLHCNFPNYQQCIYKNMPRHEPSQQTKGILKSDCGIFHIAAFESQFSYFSQNLGLCEFDFRKFGCLGEQLLGLIIMPAQHEDVAQSFRNRVTRGSTGGTRSALSYTILLLGDLQRMLGPRLFRGDERRPQSLLAVPRGIEVISQIEDPVGKILSQ